MNALPSQPFDDGPNLFLVGAPKCGTTSLYEYLRVHPDIYFPHAAHDDASGDAAYWSGKEPAYFCTDLDLTLDHPVRDAAQYRALYAPATTQRWRGDASGFHLHSEAAAANIHAACPDARILILLRPPVEQMHSLHQHLLRVGHETEPDFHTALRLGETGQLRGDLLARRCAGAADYFGIAQYAPQIERYLQAFGHDQVHVMLLEDLAAQPAHVYREVLAFLGVKTSFAPDFRVHNGRPPDAGLETLLYRIHALPGVRQLSDLVFSSALRRRVVDWTRHRHATPAVTDPRDAALRERCRPGIQHLADLLQRDLSHWL